LSALDAEIIPDERAEAVEQELLATECPAVLREAVTHLLPEGQRLIAMLIADPPVAYAEISARLGYPSASSARPAAATWTGCAATRPSQR
jgi:hypothetical protein